ncbi:MYB-like DNA-binding domain-containing protein [Cryptosporidium andersoni]|uniref:MYB-like DNA-binding domain-containing protein n=1 Tax=Cryptosporidium andersoni TaxID=117008 RepID=A0A1J4MV03_9CRYT|nr:MYB-like DNA-binding domain-containing protein [Cryptosporidium andersoni]
MDKLLFEYLDCINELKRIRTQYFRKYMKYCIWIWQYELIKNFNDLKYRKRPGIEDRKYDNMSLFINNEGISAPSNGETILKNRARRLLPSYRRKYDWNHGIWLSSEIKNLAKLVDLHLETSIIEISAKLRLYESCLNNEESDVTYKMKYLDNLLIQLKDKNTDLNIQDYWIEFWNHVALDIGGRCERTGKDCQITWYHLIDPNINKGPWTKEEDISLIGLASYYNGHNWRLIANKLGTGRTPYQCIVRYQRSLNKKLIKSSWNKDEDEKLLSIIESMGGFDILEAHKCTSKWNYVASYLPGRTNQQCRSRYVRSIKKTLKHGPWTLYEDVRLQFAVSIYGQNSWVKISRHIPGKDDAKCRERFVNLLKPEIYKGPWSVKENELLIDAVHRFGPGNWSKIKDFVLGRTDADCARQWERLDPISSCKYDLSRAKYQRLLPHSNKWIGLARSNHRLLVDIQCNNNTNESKDNSNSNDCNINNNIKSQLSGLDFYLEPAQKLLDIVQNVFNRDNFNSSSNSKDLVFEDCTINNGSNIDDSLNNLQYELKSLSSGDIEVDKIFKKVKKSIIKKLSNKLHI